jgi:hypothetical protein
VNEPPAVVTAPASLNPRPAAPATPATPAPATTPVARRCTSRRSFRIRVPHLRHGERAIRANVYVNGKAVKVIRGGRLRAKVVLTGLPRGTYQVKIVTRTNRGRIVTMHRRYRTCVGKLPSTKAVGARQ